MNALIPALIDIALILGMLIAGRRQLDGYEATMWFVNSWPSIVFTSFICVFLLGVLEMIAVTVIGPSILIVFGPVFWVAALITTVVLLIQNCNHTRR